MDSRRNTSAPTFDDDQDSTRACTTSFDGTAFGYKHGMMLAVGVQEDLFVDEFSVNNLSSLGRQINDDGDGCEEERCSSTTQADRRKQIKEDDPFNDSLAREISFKWSVLEDTRNSGIQGTCISEINPCDPSSARIADSPASSVSSCSANVRLATLTKLFPSNGKVVSTAPEQKRANCCKLQSKHSENDGEVISTAGEQERANCKLQSEHSDSDCHSCEEYISSLRTKDNENWEKSFVKPVEEEDHFEDVLFDDIAEGEKQESAGAWDSVYSFEPFQHSFSVSPKSSSAPRLSSSSFDAESSFASPLDSPLHQRPGLHLAKGSSSLVHLIDSAIQGSDSKSLQRLRRIVAGHETVSLENDENNHGEDVTWWVVDNVLAKMGFVEGCDGGEESSASPIMLGAGAAILGGNLIPWLPTVPDKKLGISARTRMMKSLALILNACTRNRALCSAAGLLLVLLRTLFIIHDRSVDRTDQMVECDDGPLLDAIEALGAHSLSVSDLQEWLNIAGDLIPEKISLDLMFALERAMLREETKGPSYSFEFDGVNSGLLAPGEAKWPFANGYAFATWLYIESFAEGVMQATVAETNTKSLALSAAPCINDLRGEETARMPRLFSFLSTDKEGIEAYFQNGLLIIETTSGKGKQSSVCFNHPFNPRHWYFVGVEHTYRQVLWGKTESEVRLYIDGRLYETEFLELPRISKALELCCIGAKPGVALARSQSRHRQCPSCAEFGPFYIFKEPIGSAKMAQLAARGADALPSFGNGAGISRLSVRKSFAEESVTLDTEIGFQLHLLYHPKLLVRRSCMDASPLGASGKHRRHAEVLGHVLVVHRTRPVDSIWAMAEGGPMALLPLMIGFLDKNSLQPIFPDSTISAGAALLSIPIFRIVALALRYGRIAEEMHAPQVLAYLLRHLLCVPWEREKELVSSVIYLSLAFNKDTVLKVQFFKYVLLNLKVWCCCPPEVQKMYLSSLSDIIVTDESTMRDANAVQMLLDGCRSCYWLTPEVDSVCKLDNGRSCRPVLQPNPLVDELLIVVELLINSAQRSTVTANIRCLVQFVLDCPQRHQVARVLNLLCRLVRQPNPSHAAVFAELLLANLILEAFLVLLQREAEQKGAVSTHDHVDVKLELAKESKNSFGINAGNLGSMQNGIEHARHNCGEGLEVVSSCLSDMTGELEEHCRSSRDRFESEQPDINSPDSVDLETVSTGSGKQDFENFVTDDVMVEIINFLGAMLFGGYLKLPNIFDLPSSDALISSGSQDRVDDIVPEVERGMWLVYSLQNAFQAAPSTLLTEDVYTAVLAAVVGSEANTLSSEDRITMWCSDHWFQNFELLMALLRSLPHASLQIQMRALQDIFILASTSSENRFKLTTMTEWPDWILEILISNYEAKARKLCDNHTSFHDIEDLIYSILTIVLHYSMRIEDGWKDVEAVIQCAEWSAILGGSSIGEQRMRREESLPKFKRRLLGNLLDFSVRELQKQAENAAAVAAAVAAENSNANAAKAEAEAATQKSLSLCRNSLVLLMFVEDHLRLQCNGYSLAKGPQIVIAPELDVAEAMDEPYESVRCAFASYGSYGIDLAEGWKFRSQLWHGVGLLTGTAFGGGGRDLETVNSMAEKEGNGEWIEYSLVNKSVEMLQALLMNSSDFGGEAGVGGGAGSLQALQQLLDNDQTFYAMLRMVLLALREEDRGGNHKSSKSKYASTFSEMHFEMRSLEDSERVPSPADIADDKTRMTTSRMTDLLQCVLAPLLTRVVSESRRQRVLVALCILYSELWHSVSSEGKLLREHYLNTIVPLLIRLLRKWRPFLTGIYELTCANGLSPLTIEDLSILTDVPSTEAALTLISPFWAAAFASPPAAMALAIAAAGVGEGEMPVPKVLYAEQGIRHVERNTLRLLSFSNLLRSTEAPSKATSMHNRKERGSASQEVDKEHKVDYVKAFRVANMESSVQRRTASDRERARRWNILKAMNSIWLDCFPSTADMATGSVLQASQTSSKCSINLLRMVEDTRNRHLEEIQRRARASADDDKATSIGVHAWCSFVHRLLEMEALVGPVLK
ncbi:hypothetical protein O6H91_20G008500 [Diphasiastrum complanatum]|uniref:Uncharacterized protein n=2 Tax=Diphasiastrum complanatum TaxID=34168 RepID=A0ACC2AML0_DIPCM|nr:hypothetical protein O6H91_20G008500 [Diphasiastrum complanatum]KAJ7518791.1 hypothetical protein O6H91_20G008500 [Diphasiastrum complanatum]